MSRTTAEAPAFALENAGSITPTALRSALAPVLERALTLLQEGDTTAEAPKFETAEGNVRIRTRKVNGKKSEIKSVVSEGKIIYFHFPPNDDADFEAELIRANSNRLHVEVRYHNDPKDGYIIDEVEVKEK